MGYRTISGYESRNRNVLRCFLKAASDAWSLLRGTGCIMSYTMAGAKTKVVHAWGDWGRVCNVLLPCSGRRPDIESSMVDRWRTTRIWHGSYTTRSESVPCDDSMSLRAHSRVPPPRSVKWYNPLSTSQLRLVLNLATPEGWTSKNELHLYQYHILFCNRIYKCGISVWYNCGGRSFSLTFKFNCLVMPFFGVLQNILLLLYNVHAISNTLP